MPRDLVKRMGSLAKASDSPEVIAAKISRISAVKRAAREWAEQMEGSICKWIEQNGDLMVPGSDVRYYVGSKRTARCVNTVKCFLALLEATGGDVTEAAAAISANGIKSGAAKVLLGAEWDAYFVVEQEDRMQEGKPIRRLKRFDPKYTPKKGVGQ